MLADFDLARPGKTFHDLGPITGPLDGVAGDVLCSINNGQGPSVLLFGGVHGDEYEAQIALRRLAERTRPDAILVGCTGPVVDVLVADVLAGLRPRPVFVSGLPGISVPATEKAWLFRSGCDLFVVHSEREVAEFSEIAGRLGGGGAVGLARLPFLRPGAAAGLSAGPGP